MSTTPYTPPPPPRTDTPEFAAACAGWAVYLMARYGEDHLVTAREVAESFARKIDLTEILEGDGEGDPDRLYCDVFLRDRAGAWTPDLDTADRETLMEGVLEIRAEERARCLKLARLRHTGPTGEVTAGEMPAGVQDFLIQAREHGLIDVPEMWELSCNFGTHWRRLMREVLRWAEADPTPMGRKIEVHLMKYNIEACRALGDAGQ